MASRAKLHDELCELLGSRNVYFQPPASLQMRYDAIRYELADKDIKRANDDVYLMTNQYSGVIIATNPDTALPDMLLKHFKMCSFGRPYTADNLNHYPFTLYY